MREEKQKELVRIFDEACYRHNRWNVWSDFVLMAAISISNCVDKSNAESRERDYMAMAQKYNKRELECLSNMLAAVITGLEANPDQDFLGELYMSLDLGNEHAGQFFTPYDVCKCMAKITGGADLKARIEHDGWISVNDTACGAGALLVAFANECLEQKVNYQTSVLFVAQDIDPIVAAMCYIQMSLLGCAGYVVVGNTLTTPSTCIDRRGLIARPGQNIWYTPFYFHNVWSWRRAWAQMDMLFASGCEEQKAIPEVVEEQKPELEPEPTVIAFNTTKTGQLTLF